MIQQLMFDLQLLWTKKNYRFFLLTLNLIYFVVGIQLFHYRPYACLLFTIMVAAVNTYIILGIANSHYTRNHQTVSNYRLCIYYPIKRGHYYASKGILTGIVLCVQCVWSTVIIFCACMIHKESFEWEKVFPYILAIYMMVAIISSVIIMTCFTAKSFQIGSVLTFTLIGMACGFFMGYYEEYGTNQIPSKMLVVALILLGVWILSNFFAEFISKHISS